MKKLLLVFGLAALLLLPTAQAQGAGDPTPTTDTGTVTCPATLTMNGDWTRGASQSSNTFVRFVEVQGEVPGDADLRDNQGATFTGLVDDGAGASGDHAANTFYNNAAGTSYQFLARSGAGGTEQLGAVVFEEEEQCTITGLAGALALIHNEIIVDITASQASCAGDQTSFSIDADETAIITVSDLDVDIIRTNDGVVLLETDEASMLTANQGQIFFFNRTLPPGTYIAWVRVDLGGLGAVDAFDSVAFNVPQGTCVDTPTVPTDLTPVFENFTALRVNLTRMEARLNTTCQKTTSIDCEGIKGRLNVTFLSTMNQINLLWARANTTCQKTVFSAVGCEGVENLCVVGSCNITVDNGPVIQALSESQMQFIGYSTAESWTLLFLIGLLIWSLYLEWYFIAGFMTVSIIGVLMRLGEWNLPVAVFLIIIGFWLQLWFNKRKAAVAEAGAGPA